ncbi:Dihydropteroate synthase [Tothia fuscella]|uniref:Folic acid synthesis protein FOL1 n=1 Tax=Tothia fuscella TaxID=1048955 RepID=A0A9P4NXU1_9PEZI|nr:Dihydropteroate synthase [Tothia fuscella]
MQRVTVALGSNMGNRFQEIEQACVEMESAGMIITRTSGLWETEAMYFLDQDNFLNGVCEVWVRSGGPAEFLQKLQEIECKLGRVKFIDKGPRCIDLDILLWGGETVNLPHIPLTIPHKSILEREFVLRPLCQLIPNESLPLPGPGGTFQAHLSRLENSTFAKNRSKNIPTMPISTQVPLYLGSTPLTPSLAKRRTRIMSILNLTPDSFSDGGRHSAEDLISLNDTITRHIKHGVSIIDIGGQSSRPGAKSITSDEELSRILPAIKLIRDIDAEIFEKKSRLANVTISIDTYRADVAKAAIEAGAHIINDISAGTMDPDMLSTVAKLGCTYILMHMRGTPETMTLPENTTYEGDIIQIIGQELSARVAAAEKAGIRRWRMILDPGIGFAKTGNQNLEILRRLSELRSFPGLQDMPWLVGTSRKGFIGKITGVKEAHERNWGTAATVTAAVQGGADIVRVHDVDEMIKVVKVADAIWRTRGVNP